MSTLYLYENAGLAARAAREHPHERGDLFSECGAALLGHRFDRLVIRFDSLFHSLHDERMVDGLAEARRKLKPTGTVVIEDRVTQAEAVAAMDAVIERHWKGMNARHRLEADVREAHAALLEAETTYNAAVAKLRGVK